MIVLFVLLNVAAFITVCALVAIALEIPLPDTRPAQAITADIAAKALACHGAEARKRTAREVYDDFHNRLRAEAQASKARRAV